MTKHNKTNAILVFFIPINSTKFNKTNASKQIEKSIKKKYKFQLNAIQSYGIITKRWSETTFYKNCKLDFYKQFQNSSKCNSAKCVYHIEFFHEINVPIYKHKAPQNWGRPDETILKKIIEQNESILNYQNKYNLEIYTIGIYHQFMHLIWNNQKIFEIRTALNHVPFAAETELQEINKSHKNQQKKRAKRLKKGKLEYPINNNIKIQLKQQHQNTVETTKRQRLRKYQCNIANNNLRFFNYFMNDAHRTFYEKNNNNDPLIASKMETDKLFLKCAHYANTVFNVSYNSFISNKPLRCWKKFKGTREFKTVNDLEHELKKEEMEISLVFL